MARTLDGADIPFANIESNLYRRGSMKLGTTVKPLDGPKDLDFVCEFNISHSTADPMRLLYAMYNVHPTDCRFSKSPAADAGRKG
jgi:hypothetical protein